jgi:CubicO group peptidase (beta-lactamase class C family)
LRPTPARLARPLALALLLLTAAHAQQPQRLPEEKIRKIEQLITAEMSRQSVAGLSVAVVTENQLRWSAGYGLADIENFVPARGLTVYRLGSISKPITAVAVMQLAERGRLDLDAPVQKYCPAYPAKQWPVTARLILGHLAGIRHYNSEAEFDSTRFYPTITDGLSMFKDDPLLHEPGTKYGYTTHGYAVLGCAVEGAAGQKFADYVRENISAPAGAERLRIDSVSDIIPGRAQGYRRTRDGSLRNSALADTSYKIPGGGFVSTVEDLARFAVAVQTAKLTKPETVAQMFTRQKLKDGTETSYGLGWSVATIEGQRATGHSGAQQRVSTFLHMLPDRGFAVVVMVNVEDTRLQPLVTQITDAVLK